MNMNLMTNKINNFFNNFINIFYNIISLNKLPIKSSLTYFILLLIGVISSLLIRFNCINMFILPFPEYINNIIKIISILYSFFLFFNYIIISVHAFKLIDFLKFKIKYNNPHKLNRHTLFIGYYLYYYYITFVVSHIVTFNYKILVNSLHYNGENIQQILGIFNINYLYLTLLLLIFILA